MKKRQRLDLQRLRKDFGLTQKQLAQMVGTPQSYISYIERGRADASESFMSKLLSVLKITSLDAYLTEASQDSVHTENLHIITINKLLNMLEAKDLRIAELEAELRKYQTLNMGK